MARGESKGTSSGSPEMDVYVGLSVVAFIAMLTALLLLIFWGLREYKVF